MVYERRIIARALGVVAILAGLSILLLWWLNRAAAAHGGHDLSSFIFIAPVPLIGGFGMWRLRRWGALLLAAPLVIALVRLTRSASNAEVSTWVLLLNVSLFGAPLAVLAWTWPELRWWHRNGG